MTSPKVINAEMLQTKKASKKGRNSKIYRVLIDTELRLAEVGEATSENVRTDVSSDQLRLWLIRRWMNTSTGLHAYVDAIERSND